MGRLAKKRGPLYAAAGAVAAVIALVLYATGTGDSIDLETQDARFEIRGAEDPAQDIVLVDVDAKTLEKIGLFPFPRSNHAKVIDRLTEAGAAVIAYDVQFTEQTNPKDDTALVAAVRRATKTTPVVLATTEVDVDGKTNIFGGGAFLKGTGALPADSTLNIEEDGVVRRFDYAPYGLETFPVVAVEAETGQQVAPGDFSDDGELTDYAGPTGTYPNHSFIDVLQGKVPPGELAGKVVIVGVTSATEQDIHPVPFSERGLMPGTEVHANAMANVGAGVPLKATSSIVDVALIVLTAFLAPVANLRLSPLRAFAVALAGAAAFAILAQLAFNAGHVVPVLYPLVALAISGVALLAASYILEAFERQRARDTFSRFVPEAVVGKLLARDAEVSLGGERAEVTVLFSDIRGFTTFCESRAPEEVIGILNRYLGEMNQAILDHGGTLIAYLGDGILGVFGAPLEQSDHADRGLAAARAMLGERLEAFNAWVTAEGLGDGFRMGVGLHSGPVMVGMVGSETALDYTVIGDTVNTASRLEGMTKGTEHQLFVSEATRARLSGNLDDLVFVEEMPVRGRAGDIRVWAPRSSENRPMG